MHRNRLDEVSAPSVSGKELPRSISLLPHSLLGSLIGRQGGDLPAAEYALPPSSLEQAFRIGKMKISRKRKKGRRLS